VFGKHRQSLASFTPLAPASSLKISLREVAQNKVSWHFGLVIHASGGVMSEEQQIIEHFIDTTNKWVPHVCMLSP
jgi:hypothetical protein